jgi:hypothetical protein
LQLRSVDGDVCVRIERRNDGSGSNANTSWTLLDARVGPSGEVCHAGEASALCWHSSHHNFDDWAHVSCGGVHYDINVAMTGHGATPTYVLQAFEGGPAPGGACAPTTEGTCPLAPLLELVPVP